MAITKEELSNAAFHAKLAYSAGWQDARELVWASLREHDSDEHVQGILLKLLESMSDARDEMREAYLKALDL